MQCESDCKNNLIMVYDICIYALEILMSCLTLEQWVELFYVDLYPITSVWIG